MTAVRREYESVGEDLFPERDLLGVEILFGGGVEEQYPLYWGTPVRYG